MRFEDSSRHDLAFVELNGNLYYFDDFHIQWLTRAFPEISKYVYVLFNAIPSGRVSEMDDGEIKMVISRSLDKYRSTILSDLEIPTMKKVTVEYDQRHTDKDDPVDVAIALKRSARMHNRTGKLPSDVIAWVKKYLPEVYKNLARIP